MPTFFDNKDIHNFFISNKIVLLEEKNLYIVDNDDIEKFILPKKFDEIIIDENGIINLFSKMDKYQFEMPKFVKKDETISFIIFNKNESCNNIDIFVSGATRKRSYNSF